MTDVMVEVEADGPIPGDYSMIAHGAVVVEPTLDRMFRGHLRPISVKRSPVPSVSTRSRRHDCGDRRASRSVRAAAAPALRPSLVAATGLEPVTCGL
jgi:hypothetical protein